MKREFNCQCVVCGKNMHLKPYRLKRVKHGITCSKKCDSINRSEWFCGEGNHQYGLREDKNASFKSWRILTSNGYIMVHAKDHPLCNKNRMVLEHRLVIEQNASLFDSKYFNEIDGKKYLKKEFDVHHKNGIKSDNRIENLQIITKAEHTRLHDLEREMIRNKHGRFIGMIKKGKPYTIKIKLLDKACMPIKKTNGANAYDCYSTKNVIIKKGTREKIPLGFAIELPYHMSAEIMPRSGLSSKGIDVCYGLIDEDYKGELSAVVVNNSSEDFSVKKLDRVCQLKITQYEYCQFLEVSELSETERGENGFGSTGI